VFAYISAVVESQWAVNVNLIGGVALLSYMLFGLRLIPSVLLAIIVASLIFKPQGAIVPLELAMMTFTCTVAPAIALYIMSSAKRINISNIVSITFKQVLILSFLQAIFCSIFKLAQLATTTEHTLPIAMAESFSSFFVIDFIGTATLVYVAIQIIIYSKKIKPTQFS
jgi:hypothetical protein